MPHIIIEHSSNISDNINIRALLDDLHNLLASLGIDKARIKTRAIPIKDTVVGEKGSGDQMAHGTLLLLEGRDTATRKQYGDALYAKMKEHILATASNCAVTLEIREMNPDTYYM